MGEQAAGVGALLDGVVDLVVAARAMPLSGSCVVNRAELLADLERLRAALPPELEWARVLLAERDELIAHARGQAEAIVAAAVDERARLLCGQEILREAQDEAAGVLEGARVRAGEMQAEVEEYIARRLATFEDVLRRTLDTVVRGRETLTDRPEIALSAPPGAPADGARLAGAR